MPWPSNGAWDDFIDVTCNLRDIGQSSESSGRWNMRGKRSMDFQDEFKIRRVIWVLRWHLDLVDSREELEELG